MHFPKLSNKSKSGKVFGYKNKVDKVAEKSLFCGEFLEKNKSKQAQLWTALLNSFFSNGGISKAF